MKPFTINTSNEDFVKRQKSVFDQLNILENNRQHSQCFNTEMEVDESSNRKERQFSRREMKPYRGKESIFKKPQEPSLTKNYIKKMPDFKKNPHKWIKYSLDDVKDEDMSEKSNTNAALSFLNDLRNRNPCSTSEPKSEPQKIVFVSKLHKPNNGNNDEDDKPTFRSSKVVMPEYVVGQKVKKDKKNRTIKAGKSKELKLDHLFEDE